MKSKPPRTLVDSTSHSPRRFLGAPARAIPLLRDVEKALDSADLVAAERLLALALLTAPGHHYTLHLLGRSHFLRGRLQDAATTFAEALQAAPDDVDSMIGLGKAQSAQGDGAAAAATLRRAVQLQPTMSNLMDVGIALDASADAEGALQVADRMLAMDPAAARARLLRARSLQALGRIDDTAREYRELIRRRQEVAAAWFALMDIKTIRLTVDEFIALRRDAADDRFNATERSLLGYAWGRACEDAGEYADAVLAFDEANRLVRQRVVWSAERFSGEVDQLIEVFGKPETAAPSDLGREVIFIVGLPRSGTTLLEQILGAHSQVEGANELPDMAAVIDAETRRRRQPFAEWAAIASAQDWERLGREYLQRTQRWRSEKPIHTDKMPENWLYVGAIRAMLPAARIIDSRRDPVETAWSCYKQLFGPNRVTYSYDATELAEYWRDYDRFMCSMLGRHPLAIRAQSHESLISNLQHEVRLLLGFCGLRWEEACLQPHRSERAVRTASSAQVREPVSGRVARADSYGASLEGFKTIILSSGKGVERTHSRQ